MPLRLAVLSFRHMHATGYAHQALEHPDPGIIAVRTDFPRRIRDGTRPVHAHEEGTHVLKVILAAYQSAQQRQEIGP